MRCFIYMLGVLGVFFLAISIAHAVEFTQEVPIITSDTGIPGDWADGAISTNCATQLRKRGWTQTCNMIDLEFVLPENIDVSTIKTAKLISWGTSESYGSNINYFVNKTCNVSYAKDCVNWVSAQGMYVSGRCPTGCQFPEGAHVDRFWCGHYGKCAFDGVYCQSWYNQTIYDCKWDTAGSLYIPPTKYYNWNPASADVPISAITSGVNKIALSKAVIDRSVTIESLTLEITTDVECIEDNDCSEEQFCNLSSFKCESPNPIFEYTFTVPIITEEISIPGDWGIENGISVPSMYAKQCQTVLRNSGWYVNCNMLDLNYQLPEGLNVSAIKSARLVGSGTSTPDTTQLYYYFNKHCNITQTQECSHWNYGYDFIAPGTCKIYGWNSYDLSKCQFPDGARETSCNEYKNGWYIGPHCMYNAYVCDGSYYTSTKYDCNWDSAGSVNVPMYDWPTPISIDVPTNVLKEGKNELSLSKPYTFMYLDVYDLSLEYTMDIQCLDDGYCDENMYCGNDYKCHENNIPPAPGPDEQNVIGFIPAGGSDSNTQTGNQQTDNAIIYGSAIAAGIASVGILGVTAWKKRSAIQIQLNQISSSLNRANVSAENINAYTTSTFADIFPNNPLAKIARYWGYEFDAAKEWITGKAIPSLTNGWKEIKQNPKDNIKKGLESAVVVNFALNLAVVNSLSNAIKDPVGWFSNGTNKIGNAISSGATAYLNALKDDPVRTLGKTAITVASVLGIVGGLILAPITGGGSLALTAAGIAGLSGAGMIFAQGSYEAVTAKTEEERKKLAAEHVDDLIWIPSGVIGGAQSLKLGIAIKPNAVIKLSTAEINQIAKESPEIAEDITKLLDSPAGVIKNTEDVPSSFWDSLKSLGKIKKVAKDGTYYFESIDKTKGLALKTRKIIEWHEAGHIVQAKNVIKAPAWAWKNGNIAESIADKFAAKFVGTKNLIDAKSGFWLRMQNLKQIKNAVNIPTWLSKPWISYKAPVVLGATVLKKQIKASSNKTSSSNTKSSTNTTKSSTTASKPKSSSPATKVANTVSKAVNTVKTTTTKAATAVKTATVKAANTVKNTVTKAATAVKTTTTKAVNTVKNVVSNVAKKVTSILKKKK